MIVSRFNRIDNIADERRRILDVSLYLQATPRASVRRAATSANARPPCSRSMRRWSGDAPYPSFTLAMTESDRPGGHSPPYFAVLNQSLPGSTFVWRNDPVSFENYPAFFMAHELAHQWWGQAIGWKNYHEQWISEGFAQYFAALYAEKERGGDQLPSLLRQMRRTAIDASPQGPVYLGYRLGHIQGDDRIFRAIVYNKGAMVLHMLRRLMGDDVSSPGCATFYSSGNSRRLAPTTSARSWRRPPAAICSASSTRWIFGSRIPHVKFGYHVSRADVTLRFEQHAATCSTSRSR